MPVRDYKISPTRKDWGGESRGDHADSTDRGMPLRQYDPKRIRARSRFEGVSRPTNGGNRRLRTKTALELQALMTSTFKRGEEKTNQHPRGANAETGGYILPSCTCCRGKLVQERKTGESTTALRTDTTRKSAKKEGNRSCLDNPEVLDLQVSRGNKAGPE